MKNFAAIDFETANKERSSICSVGIVIVKNGIIADRIYRLIRPRPHYYSYWNTQIHGLKIEDTADAADFPTVWREIEPAIAGLPLVAHNSVFDEGCLKAVQNIRHGISRIYVLLYLPHLPKGFRKDIAQPSVAYRRTSLRIHTGKSSPCVG